MTAIEAAPAATPPLSRPSWAPSSVLTQVAVLTGRSLRALYRDPRLVVLSLIQPLVLLILFGQVFSAIALVPGFPPGLDYIDFILPALLVTTGLTAGLQSGVAVTTELRNGLIPRFRSMPIRTGSVLAARSFADVLRSASELTAMAVLAALLFGFSPPGGVLGVVGALLVAAVLCWSLGWVFMWFASWLRSPEILQTVGSLATFPLMFASNAFVPVENLPGWLRAFATVNPLSYAISAARGLATGTADLAMLGAAVGSCLVIALIAIPCALRSFRRN
ncbi:ABC transporter permease [Actinokineospora guangxiensis]|uniref:Transport permease protein n=1 Tax=Actinokineospora guangxiensis TaxID=1490288 RepID=A0ABW0EL47_9PSEU